MTVRCVLTTMPSFSLLFSAGRNQAKNDLFRKRLQSVAGLDLMVPGNQYEDVHNDGDRRQQDSQEPRPVGVQIFKAPCSWFE